MHIALFIKDFAVGKEFSKDGLPTKSGAEFHGENHAKQLIQRGNSVTIMAKKRYWFTKARENLDGIDLVRLHEPARWFEIFIRLFTTHRDIDAFYIIGTPKFAVWAVLYAKLMHKPVTLALTGKAEIFDGNANWRNRILSQCTNYIATTHEIRQGFMEKGGVPEVKISVLAHGIDTTRYPITNPGIKKTLRQENNIPADAHVLLFCARVVLNKGIDTLIHMWPIIRAKDPKSFLIVAGGGKHELIRALRKLGQENGNSVRVLGKVHNTSDYYRLSDVYVFPSRHEGLPTSLLEAMSSGLPAVTSDIGGCDDLIFNDKTGYRVDSESADVFAEKVLYLFENEQERETMGQRASKLVKDMCDYTVVVPHLEAIIKSTSSEGKDYLRHEEYGLWQSR